MTGTSPLPAVRLPDVLPDTADAPLVLELPSSNKFHIAWPDESAEHRSLPPAVALSKVHLSSSEDESSSSSPEDDNGEFDAGGRERERDRVREQDSTPTSRDVNPLEDVVTPPVRVENDNRLLRPPAVPHLSRAFSVPLPSQIGYLQNPRRLPSDSGNPLSSALVGAATLLNGTAKGSSSEFEHFHELALELADSVQMVIQTLLQLSPPQVLDPAKEQFSACSLPIPTPSISALLTSMKNLNYMSANMPALVAGPEWQPPASVLADEPEPVSKPSSEPEADTDILDLPTAHSPIERVTYSDFDIGETLQSVGDALSGIAAESGVDLVLYHGDVGMKHIAVKGDENGLSYTLSHIVRRIIATAHWGDAVEIGLFLVAPAQAPSDDQDEADAALQEIPLDATTSAAPNALPDPDAPLRCTFQITHVFAPASDDDDTRDEPELSSYILSRLLNHIQATFTPVVTRTARNIKLSLTLDRGSPTVVNPAVVFPDDDPVLQAFPDLRISGEPTLEDLAAFTDSLKGQRAKLYAASRALFARHLTSYLTSWGLDVTPVSTDRGERGSPERNHDSPSPAPLQEQAGQRPPPTNEAYVGSATLQTLPEQDATDVSSAAPEPPAPAFIIIDDDVEVLRERLRKMRADAAYPLHMSSSATTASGRSKRPSLASHHRPRSSPQIARAMSTASGGPPTVKDGMVRAPPPVLIHFTSLSNFKLVKGILQSTLVSSATSPSHIRMPEVIVIPKPAGPRRVLTALHTAATKPIVDPFFTPIATSPLSPSLHLPTSYFASSGTSPRSPLPPRTGSGSGSSPRSGSGPSSAHTDGMHGPGGMQGPMPPSPLGLSEGLDYFSEAAVRLGTSPSSGLVIQSPDGQPAGIFFHPRMRASRSSGSGHRDHREHREHERGVGEHRQTQVQRNKQQLLRRHTHALADAAAVSPPIAAAVGIVMGVGAGANGQATKTKANAVPPTGPNAIVNSTGTSSSVGASAKSPPVLAMDVVPPTPDPVPAVGLEANPRSPTAMRKVSPVEALRKSTPPGSPRVSGTGSRRGSVLRAPASAPGASSNGTGAETPTQAKPQLAAKKKKTEPGIVPPINVLVVEDNPINQAILTTFMRRKQIKYDVAKNGEEAIAKWRSGKFHLILMDIQMPVMDGITATKEIRRLEKINALQGFPSTPSSEGGGGGQRTPDTPLTAASTSASPYRSSVIIVALTASSLQSDRVTALAAGCNDFLTKPVSLDWLNSKIIEWGSIKALQMWADIKPETARGFARGQNAQAQSVARKLKVPEGRATPVEAQSRSPSAPRSPSSSTTPVGSKTQVKDIVTPSPVGSKTQAKDVVTPSLGAAFSDPPSPPKPKPPAQPSTEPEPEPASSELTPSRNEVLEGSANSGRDENRIPGAAEQSPGDSASEAQQDGGDADEDGGTVAPG